ncbi:hypothetical protein ACI65C_003889 [Semiaphis heraclei]
MQSTSSSEVDEELDANEALEDLRIFFTDLTILLEIMDGISSIEITEKKEFKLVGKEFSDYLKKFLKNLIYLYHMLENYVGYEYCGQNIKL